MRAPRALRRARGKAGRQERLCREDAEGTIAQRGERRQGGLARPAERLERAPLLWEVDECAQLPQRVPDHPPGLRDGNHRAPARHHLLAQPRDLRTMPAPQAARAGGADGCRRREGAGADMVGEVREGDAARFVREQDGGDERRRRYHLRSPRGASGGTGRGGAGRGAWGLRVCQRTDAAWSHGGGWIEFGARGRGGG